MKEEDIGRVTRWIDGELNDGEIRDLLEEHPSLREERSAMLEIGRWIREETPGEMEVPFPEVFQRQILRRIEKEQDTSIWNWGGRILTWLTISEWGLPLAASATLMVLLTVGLRVQGGSHHQSRVVHTFTPNPAHVAQTREVDRVGVTVIALEGLAPVPAATPVMGYFPTSSRQETGLAATTYFEGKQPRLLLSMNSAGNPCLQRIR